MHGELSALECDFDKGMQDVAESKVYVGLQNDFCTAVHLQF